MSKLLFSAILLLVFSTSSSSQQTTTPQKLSNANYLKKSKSQVTTAWILLGGGFALVSAGIVVAFVDGLGEAFTQIVTLGSTEPEKTFDTGGSLFFTGLAAMAGSIPFFIASSKNKRKADKIVMVLKMEKSTCFQQQLFKQISYPAVSLKISL